MGTQAFLSAAAFAFAVLTAGGSAIAQVPPSPAEVAGYAGLHAAAAAGDVAEIRRLAGAGAAIDSTDGRGRTPLHVAAFASDEAAVTALVELGADPNRLENDKYDIITIAAVAGDAEMVRLAASLGGNSANVTSIYDGTALIAASHLGHVEVVAALIEAKAPLDHINNLGWTALLESVILGDGGPRHVATARALVEAGADISIADRQGRTPLDHARQRGYADMITLLEQAQNQ
jgi:ankyrin repeat protein